MSQNINRKNIFSQPPGFWGHLIRFLVYNFIGALLPLFIAFSIRKTANIPPTPGVYAPELLFFAIMISATALGDITDETKIVGNAPLFQSIKGALLFGAIATGVFYGMYQYDAIVGPGNPSFRSNITRYTFYLTIFYLLQA